MEGAGCGPVLLRRIGVLLLALVAQAVLLGLLLLGFPLLVLHLLVLVVQGNLDLRFLQQPVEHLQGRGTEGNHRQMVR